MPEVSRKRIAPRRREFEWPTWLLCIAVYGSWLALTWFWRIVPAPLLALLGGAVIAWHSGFQHETIHGHPSRWRWLNHLLGWPPLALWLPYASYRDSHRRHHDCAELTDPLLDPESSYQTGSRWHRIGPCARLLARFNMSLSGRLTIGVPWMVSSYLWSEFRAIRADEAGVRAVWLRHLAGMALILAWVIGICGMSGWRYLLIFVWPGTALIRLRGYAEHRWAPQQERRTSIVESPWLGWLFLHNNLHLIHHEQPAVPWYRLPQLYRHRGADWRAEHASSIHRGYSAVLRRFLWRTYDRPDYPGAKPGR